MLSPGISDLAVLDLVAVVEDGPSRIERRRLDAPLAAGTPRHRNRRLVRMTCRGERRGGRRGGVVAFRQAKARDAALEGNRPAAGLAAAPATEAAEAWGPVAAQYAAARLAAGAWVRVACRGGVFCVASLGAVELDVALHESRARACRSPG